MMLSVCVCVMHVCTFGWLRKLIQLSPKIGDNAGCDTALGLYQQPCEAWGNYSPRLNWGEFYSAPKDHRCSFLTDIHNFGSRGLRELISPNTFIKSFTPM